MKDTQQWLKSLKHMSKDDYLSLEFLDDAASVLKELQTSGIAISKTYRNMTEETVNKYKTARDDFPKIAPIVVCSNEDGVSMRHETVILVF